MKHFSILEPASGKLVEIMTKERGRDLKKFRNLPQEDYLLVSNKYLIFVVADGVTLEPDENGNYPSPSGAGEVARIFCKKVIEETEEKYQNFTEADIPEIFRKANEAVREYNKNQGRIKETIDYWRFDLFAATGAFAVVKDAKVHWASICDSYVAKFSEENNLAFQSPECWPCLNKNLPEDWKEIDREQRKKTLRKTYRNGINEKGELIGYGVINGEETANRYLNFGSFPVKDRELVMIFTDGFEDYVKLPEFISLFRNDWENLENRIKVFTKTKAHENPHRYGHERSLIIVSLE